MSNNESPDHNVEAVRQKMLDRSKFGLEKYGVTTQRTDIDLAGWLNHLQEELMDAAIYCQAAMNNHSDIATLEQEIKQMRAEHSDMLSALERCEMFKLQPITIQQIVNSTIEKLKL